jgi:type I restriction enzyme S subunit
MAGEWRECALGDVIELKRGYDLPQQERRPGAVPIVSSSGVTDYHAEAMATGPGVVTGRYGTLGQVFYIEQGFWPLNTTLYVRNFKGNDPRFISYFMRSLDFLAYSDKAAVPGVNRNHLHQARVVVPTDVGEQRAIAHILGTLDDKIELNRRMSETLEAMARALFKSWFVDFDPVRAKAEGRDPGLPKPLADLFPARLVDSELGEIPKGWELGCVDDEFELTMGQSPPGETYNESGEGLPFYQGRADFGSRFPTRRVYCTAPTRLAKAGDTLISVRAPVGYINMATEDCAIGRGVAAARHRSGSRSYTYHFMVGLEEVFGRFEAEGTVFGSIGKKDFHAISCARPPRAVVAEFEALLAPIDSRIDVTERESRTLAALRDTLLPKLISGELRVGDLAAENIESLDSA